MSSYSYVLAPRSAFADPELYSICHAPLRLRARAPCTTQHRRPGRPAGLAHGMRSLPRWEELKRTAAWGVGPCGVRDGGGYTFDRRQLLRKDVLLRTTTIDVPAACACIAFLTSWWSARGPPGRGIDMIVVSCVHA